MTYQQMMNRSMGVRQARRAVHTARYWREMGNRSEAAYWLRQAGSIRRTISGE